MKITDGGLDDARVQALLAHHFATARAETAPGSAHALDLTGSANPIYTKTDIRSWTDLNKDGTVINPDGTPQFAEVGPSRTIGFGTLSGTTSEEPGLRRDKNMNYEVSLQHTLRPRVSVRLVPCTPTRSQSVRR